MILLSLWSKSLLSGFIFRRKQYLLHLLWNFDSHGITFPLHNTTSYSSSWLTLSKLELNINVLLPVWPDDEIKVAQFSPKVAQKGAKVVLLKNCHFYQLLKNVTKHLGYFYNKICCQGNLKIAQSGRTDCYYSFASIASLSSSSTYSKIWHLPRYTIYQNLNACDWAIFVGRCATVRFLVKWKVFL